MFWSTAYYKNNDLLLFPVRNNKSIMLISVLFITYVGNLNEWYTNIF